LDPFATSFRYSIRGTAMLFMRPGKDDLVLQFRLVQRLHFLRCALRNTSERFNKIFPGSKNLFRKLRRPSIF